MSEAVVTFSGWADRITTAWRASFESVLDVGRLLAEAKAALPHGEFTAMIEAELPFGRQTAFRLMAIRNDERLSQVAHVQLMPASWGTLYELTKLDDATFEAGIERGIIRSDMERKDLAPLLTARHRSINQVARESLSDACTTADLNTLIASGRRFGTIYADPPWLYDNQGTRAATSNHYDGMTVEALCELPVAQLAARDAHLHLWTTNGFLFECPRIFAAWGFEFRSTFIWVKPQIGIGNYWRNSHEILLTAVRGDAHSFADHSMPSWIQCDRGRHSAKPEQVRAMLERASPGPRLELFARTASAGWTAWGNEIERNLFYRDAEGVAA